VDKELPPQYFVIGNEAFTTGGKQLLTSNNITAIVKKKTITNKYSSIATAIHGGMYRRIIPFRSSNDAM
jgi:hypothetical protein